MKNLKTLLTMYKTFIKIGGFTIGGGYAMLPVIQREAVDVYKWATEDEMADMITLAEFMPGVLGINAATALGMKVAGIPGAVACTLGMITIPFVLILVTASVLEQFKDLQPVEYAFVGIRAAVAALILYAVTRLIKPILKNIIQIVIFIAAFAVVVTSLLPMQYVLIICAIVGIIKCCWNYS